MYLNKGLIYSLALDTKKDPKMGVVYETPDFFIPPSAALRIYTNNQDNILSRNNTYFDLE